MENYDPHYRGMVDPIAADKRGRVIPAYGIRRKVIDLSSALVSQHFPDIIGDFLYCDYNTTGTAEVALNRTSEDKFPLLALSGLEGLPYEGIFVTCAAQPGKVLNLWYGYNARFISPVSAIATIGSITNAIQIAHSPGAFFASTTALVANTPQNIIAAASNLNGYTLSGGAMQGSGGGGNSGVFIAKATAPASVIDGSVIQGKSSDTAISSTKQHPAYGPIRMAAGLRLDIIMNAAGANDVNWAHYTLH